jgi:hypothetical protein
MVCDFIPDTFFFDFNEKKMRSAMSKAFDPLIRMIPIPDIPIAVAIAAIVSVELLV